MEITVTLSDGQPCQVRALGLYELEREVAPSEDLGPFYDEYEAIDGKTVRQKYIPPETPPAKPSVSRSQANIGTPAWEQWVEYDLYQAYLDHRRRETEILERHLADVRLYILRHCVENEDRVVTGEDWRLVRQAAMSSRLTEEDLADALRHTFQGQVQGSGNPGRNGRAVRRE